MSDYPSPVIGIDVGAPRKGFHAVVLRGKEAVAQFHSSDAHAVAAWCAGQNPSVIAIDAPCRWRTDEARLAERELARDRISCFSTPTEAQAQGHPFFTWMIAGAKLYAALADAFPLYDGGAQREDFAIETFPQAVACALAGEIVSAKRKNDVRRELLRLSGIDPAAFTNIEEIDAALCALTAPTCVNHDAKLYRDARGGFIVVPKTPVTGFVAQNYLAKSGSLPQAEPTRTANSRESAPPPRPRPIPIFGKESSWASFIGLFLINFGHLEFLVSAYLETQMAPAAFDAIRTRPYQERLSVAAALLTAKPDKRAGYEELKASLEAARQFRNHLAHGRLNAVVSPDGTDIDMHLIQANDLSNERGPEPRRLSFIDLERQVIAIGQLLEDFSDLVGTTPILGTVQLTKSPSGSSQ